MSTISRISKGTCNFKAYVEFHDELDLVLFVFRGSTVSIKMWREIAV